MNFTNMQPLDVTAKIAAFERDGRELKIGERQDVWVQAHKERRDWVVFAIGDLSVTVDRDELGRALAAVST